MLIEYILLLLAGILAGTACGLLPGLHVNNVGMMMFSLLPFLALSPLQFSVFLVAMASAQSFIDFLPSIFLGVPDEETVLSVLPAHKLVLEGEGMKAVHITALASLYGSFISILLLPLAFLIVHYLYNSIRSVMGPLLLFLLIYMIIREGGAVKKTWSLFVIVCSGYLGWTVLNLRVLSSSQVFLPLFSGLFGISTLILGLSSKEKIVRQRPLDCRLFDKKLLSSSFLGAVGGLLVGLLPAVSPSQVGVLLQNATDGLKRKIGRKKGSSPADFLSMIASLNTSDAIFSIFSLYLIGNPRSGISVIISDVLGRIDGSALLLLSAIMIVSGLLSYKIHIFLGGRFSYFLEKVDFRKIAVLAIVFVVLMVFLMTGPFGLLIVAISSALGIIPALTGVSRTHLMGVLLVPTMLFFFGI